MQLARSAVVQVTQLLPESLLAPEFATAPPEDFATTAVGATAGISKVDESGNFNYSLPIMVGKGVGEFKLSFALSYVSGRGIGRASMGWDLQCLEGITHCRKTIEAGDGYSNGAPFPEVRFDKLFFLRWCCCLYC